MATFEARPAGAGESAPETHLRRLSLRDFRNFESLECEIPAAGAAVVGPNGSGKTNLLEAIYYLQIFRSFRGTRDADLVRFGEDVFRIEGEIRRGDRERRVAAAYERSGRRKKVEVDRREADRLSDAIGTLGAVVFRLDDVEIIRGSPGERRRFLDILLSLVAPGYLPALREYRSVLSQRNEALREGAGPGLVAAWTDGLVAAGAKVMRARARWIADHAAAFGDYHARVAGGGSAAMAYDPSVGTDGERDAGADSPGGSVAPGGREAAGREDAGGERGAGPEAAAAAEAWAGRFRAALRRVAERERRRGVTLVGPHRDDVSFRATVAGGERRSLRGYGSSGQQRTAALALRLVETDTLQERLGHEPIYLLDDVFAELDEDRSARLLRLLDEGRTGQVILTVPKPAEIPIRGGGLERWRIRNGRILR